MAGCLLPPLLLLTALLGLCAWETRPRSRIHLELPSPTGAYRAQVVAVGKWSWPIMKTDSGIYVVDTRGKASNGGWWSSGDEDRKLVVRGRLSTLLSAVRLEWLDDSSLAIEYAASMDKPPSEFSYKDATPWRGVDFIFRPIPHYTIVVVNQRPERVTGFGTEGILTGTPYDWIEPCTQLRLTWLAWETPARRLEVGYKDQQGNVVFSVRLRTEIVGDSLMLKAQDDKVLVTTLLHPPIDSNAGEIRWVIEADPGKECP